MTNSYQFLPTKTKRVTVSNALSFMVVVCKLLIQSNFLTTTVLNEDPVFIKCWNVFEY